MIKSAVLTIAVPDNGCNKRCPYCVSEMTGKMESNIHLMRKNLLKVKTLAKSADVTSVLFTGKGEPTLNMDLMFEFASEFAEWPLELQTNGLKLLEAPTPIVRLLGIYKFNVVAISVDTLEYMDKLSRVFKALNDIGIITRATVNISDMLKGCTFEDIIMKCKEFDIKHLTLRALSVPQGKENTVQALWIKNHKCGAIYRSMLEDARLYLAKNGRPIRKTNYGMDIYDCQGVAFAHSDYCVQEENAIDDIRSIIFQENGHVYTTWNSPASILF